MTLRILAAAVVCEPAGELAYRTGEDIEVFVVTSTPGADAIGILTIPLRLGPVRRQAEPVTVEGMFRGQSGPAGGTRPPCPARNRAAGRSA